MKLQLEKRDGVTLIEACDLRESNAGAARHRFRIGGEWYAQSVIITRGGVELWQVDDARKLAGAHFEKLAALGEEIILLGAGRHAHFPAGEILQPLMRARIGFEVMDTLAACRTYNILAADMRPVAAALIA